MEQHTAGNDFTQCILIVKLSLVHRTSIIEFVLLAFSQRWNGCAPILPSRSLTADPPMAYFSSVIAFGMDFLMGTCNAWQKARSTIFRSLNYCHKSFKMLAWSPSRSGKGPLFLLFHRGTQKYHKFKNCAKSTYENNYVQHFIRQ